EARDRGAEVILVSGPTSIKKPFGIKVIDVKTNAEMLKAVENNFENSDIVIKSAAVADYKPKTYSEKKIKKGDEELSLELQKDTDILKKLGSIKKDQVLVGFAAESNDLIENATSKLHKKNLDYIVANNIVSNDTGFASEDNKVTILCSDGRKIPLPKMSKKQVARELFDLINEKR
ncbi:phosphopantothenoylcysteine decarboxylase, partial [Clostridium sp.]